MTPRPRVLLVDDDVTQLKLTRLRLADAGFEVTTASNGREALDLARRQVPAAIVSDVLMDELDGFGFCRLARGEPSLARIPIILLSSHYRDEPDQDLARRVGASALLMRTADFDVELAALRAALGTTCTGTAAADADVATYEQHLRTNAAQLTRLLDKARSAEERYRTLCDTAHDAIAVVGEDGVILEANQRWLDVLGIPPEGIIGRHVLELSAPGHERDHAELFQRVLALGTGRTGPVSLRRHDGSVALIDVAYSIAVVDGRRLLFTISRDVTDQALAARRLAAAEERYRSLIERLPDVIWTATADLRITFITPNVERILGFTVEEMCATSGGRFDEVYPDDRSTVMRAVSAYLGGHGPFDLEYRRRRKDGEWIWVHTRAFALYERDGVRYIDGVLSDVTERRRLEERLFHVAKLDAIGQLTAGIAHDFNNILATITANCHFLKEDLASGNPRSDDVNEIGRAADRAVTLTRQLLAFGRKQVLAPSIVNLDSVLSDLGKMLRRVIAEDIAIVVRPAPDLGLVRVDVGQLEQVIMNLAVNARDAMPSGGTLTFTSSNVVLDGDGREPCGPHVCLEVSDTGCGMDAETQRRIFEPFYTTKEVGKGTGLGLASCYGIVKQSGGHIQVKSAPGRGSTFSIYLPRVDGPVARARTPTAPAASGLCGTENILLVEDDPRVRQTVCRMLLARGYTVQVASDGDEAVAMAASCAVAIDLVISDVVMPGASGAEVVSQVRRRNPAARALFMSGYHDHPALRGEVLGAGQHLLQKPFTPDALARKVREVLDELPE